MSLNKVNKTTGELTGVAGSPANAAQVAYSNTESGLAAGNVQSAIDEVAPRGYKSYQIYQAAGSGWKKISGFRTSVAYDSAGFRLQVRNGGLAEINLSSHDMNGQDIKVWALNPTTKLEAIKFDADNGDLYIRVGQYTRLEITQFSGKRLPLIVTSVSEAAGDLVVIESVPLSQLPDFIFMNKVRATNYSRMGENYGWTPGFLRQGRKPKKVIVIGNSMTMHGRADSIGWTVDDHREMAASTPTSGWVSRVYTRLAALYPDIQMYKTNGAVWERGTLGSKDPSVLDSLTVYKMTSAGCEETSLTLANVLKSDVDIIICQLYENISISGYSDIGNLTTDYATLYDSFRAKCPDAFLYQFCGFWQNFNKSLAALAACQSRGVEPIVATTFNPLNTGIGGSYTNMSPAFYRCKTGDEIKDASGNTIATVSSTVAGHPNDIGFANMAANVLAHLYSSQGIGDPARYAITVQVNAASKIDSIDVIAQSQVMAQYAKIQSSDDPDSFLRLDHSLYGQYFDYFLIPGKYDVTANYLSGSDSAHGFLQVEAGAHRAYTKLLQVMHSFNRESGIEFSRNVILSSNQTQFNPWVCNRAIIQTDNVCVYYLPEVYDGNQVKRCVLVPTEDISLTNDNWTGYGKTSAVFDVIPTKIIRAFMPASTGGSIVDYNVRALVAPDLRLHYGSSDINDLTFASYESWTWKTGRAVCIDYY